MRERERSNHARDDDDDGRGYLDLDQLVRYSGLSRSTLRRHLTATVHPLPHLRVCEAGKTRGRVLVDRKAFDAWMQSFRVTPANDVSWIKVRA